VSEEGGGGEGTDSQMYNKRHLYCHTH
jgi:hypothetical protein